MIAAAGAVDHDAVVAMAERAVAPRAATARARRPRLARAARLSPRVRFCEKDTEQYHVCLGGPGIARDDERRFALRVLEGVLGGTSSSRLFQEVRERRGLAYSVFCFSSLYASTGEVGLYVGTRPENLGEALEVVAGELARSLEEPASERGAGRARENLKGRVVLGARVDRRADGPARRRLLAGMPILVGRRDDRANRRGRRVADLRALTAELFAPGRLSVVAVGPQEDAFAPRSSRSAWRTRPSSTSKA